MSNPYRNYLIRPRGIRGRARLGRSRTRFLARSCLVRADLKFSEALEALRARFFARTGSPEAPEALRALLFGSPRGTSKELFCSNRVFRGPGGTWGAPFHSNNVIACPQAYLVLKKIRKIPKKFERFGTLLNVSERVRMHRSRSEQVPARLRSYENLENLAKTSRKPRETCASAVVDLCAML